MKALTDALYARLATALVDELGTFNDGPSVFTARPVPVGAGYPVVICATTVSDMSADSMNVNGRLITRDISVYGKVPVHFDAVDEIAEKIRQIFHRKALDVAAFRVINVSASGPISAPSEAGEVGKVVSIEIRMDPR